MLRRRCIICHHYELRTKRKDELIVSLDMDQITLLEGGISPYAIAMELSGAVGKPENIIKTCQ